MSEEKFFGNVRETLYTYAPEVPAEVYGRMRRKLWVSQFLQFSAGRLNAWYLLFAGVLTVGGLMMFSGDSAQALRSGAYESDIPGLHRMVTASMPCQASSACASAPKSCTDSSADGPVASVGMGGSPATYDTPAEVLPAAPEAITTTVSEEPEVSQETAPAESPAASSEAPKKGKGLSPKILRDKNR
jgi:hypothetical protein